MANPFSDLGVSDAEFQAALDSPEVTSAKLHLAEEAAAYWRRIAPVGGPHDPHAGQYRDSIHTEIGSDNRVRVVADTPWALYIEHGTGEPGPTPEFACRAKTEAKFAYRDDQ